MQTTIVADYLPTDDPTNALIPQTPRINPPIYQNTVRKVRPQSLQKERSKSAKLNNPALHLLQALQRKKFGHCK